MAFLSHDLDNTQVLAPIMNVLFWGRCDSFKTIIWQEYVQERLKSYLRSSMANTGVLTNHMKSSAPEWYITYIIVTPRDRPKSVRNRCLIELFGGVVCIVTLPCWHFCWCRGFCHRTESDLFLFVCMYMRWLGIAICSDDIQWSDITKTCDIVAKVDLITEFDFLPNCLKFI